MPPPFFFLLLVILASGRQDQPPRFSTYYFFVSFPSFQDMRVRANSVQVLGCDSTFWFSPSLIKYPSHASRSSSSLPETSSCELNRSRSDATIPLLPDFVVSSAAAAAATADGADHATEENERDFSEKETAEREEEKELDLAEDGMSKEKEHEQNSELKSSSSNSSQIIVNEEEDDQRINNLGREKKRKKKMIKKRRRKKCKIAAAAAAASTSRCKTKRAITEKEVDKSSIQQIPPDSPMKKDTSSQFYYYSGFGPWMGKYRGSFKDNKRNFGTSEDGKKRMRPKCSQDARRNDSKDKSIEVADNAEGLDAKTVEGEEKCGSKAKGGRKRRKKELRVVARKPVKSRSLKTLL